MSKDKESAINVQGTAIAIRSQWEEDFNPLEFDRFASKMPDAGAMNMGAGGQFCINSGRQQPHGPSSAGALNVTGRIRLV